MKKKRKILFAAVDVGYRIELYTQFIKKHFSNQLEAESLVIYKIPQAHYQTSYTREFDFEGLGSLKKWTRSALNFFFCLFRYDVFHFISGETLLTRKLMGFELFMYKLFGKRVVMHFVGADIRSVAYSQWKEKNIEAFLAGKDDFPKTTPWQKKLLRLSKKYADKILVSTPDLKDLLSEAIYYPVMLDLEKFQKELSGVAQSRTNKEEIVILHSPSNKSIHIKGTQYINKILEKLANDSSNRIRLILPAEEIKERPSSYSATRYEMFGYYQEADIVIDQMIIGWYGLKSVEALAAGKQVICYIDEHLESFLFPGCPILRADIHSLENVILQAIERIRSGKTDAAAQVEWVKHYHSIEQNHDALLYAWDLKEAR
jgi:hypothetical protein